MKSVFAAIAAVGAAFATLPPQGRAPLGRLHAQAPSEVGYTYRHHSAGWPVAVDRRQARKARNVKRNRKAHK